jgi:hypothetical protein
MISELPGISIPDAIIKICSKKMGNNRSSFGLIADIIDADPFLKLYVKQVFSEYLENGDILRMLTTLGWDGFRNRLAEAYIYHARNQKFPTKIVLDEVYDVLDIENRFDFLFTEGDSKVFQFGMYLKLCDIYLENNNEYFNDDFISIPVEVDEILAKGKGRSFDSDWLVVITWSIVNIVGVEKTKKLFIENKGNWKVILDQLTIKEQDVFFACLLRYGHGVKDQNFFLGAKI